ncbi:transmembrane 4 L6 family member 1-like [Micropterus dolomieu]|uniref:transmembrane 4 L6 family member 1-like n=1 Tax=Micropterus dolomieu TaxID=147949 RepID=UPI001E8CAF1B|nr:transmembrane 4 L6 family member 1-like [Micropterus dolomieu]
MCTGKCSRCIAYTLYPLVLTSIICNIVLFFPGGDIKYAKDGHITEEVKYMGGLVGGGLLVLIPALYIGLTGEEGCCGNRFGMFLSIVFAAVGVAGGLYSFVVAALGLSNGPFCKAGGDWTTPFKNSTSSYLNDYKSWGDCTEPKNVVQFNVGLFMTLMAVSCLQVILCAIQMINGLFGCLCGACIKKEEP